MVKFVFKIIKSSILVSSLWLLLFSEVLAGSERERENENRGGDLFRVSIKSEMKDEVKLVGVMKGVDMRGMSTHVKGGHHHRKGKGRGKHPNRVHTSDIQNQVTSSTIESFFNTVALVDIGSSLSTALASSDPSASQTSSIQDLSTPTSTTDSISTSTSTYPLITPAPSPTHQNHRNQHHSSSHSQFQDQEFSNTSIVKEGPTMTKLISITTQIVRSSSHRGNKYQSNEEGSRSDRGGSGERNHLERGDKVVITELAKTTQEVKLSNGKTEIIVCQLQIIRTATIGGKSHTEEERLCAKNFNTNFFSSTVTSSQDTSTTTSTSSTESSKSTTTNSTSITKIQSGDFSSGIGVQVVGQSTIAQSDILTASSSASSDSSSSTTSSSSDASATRTTDSTTLTSSTDSSGNSDPNSSTTSDASTPTASTADISSATNSPSSSTSGFISIITSDSSSPSSSSSSPQAQATDPTTSTVSSTSDTTATSAGDQSSASAQSAFVLPGRQLSVLPIGLGIFAGVSVLALIIVGVVTYERKKYRRQYRTRKMAQQVANAAGFSGGSQGFEVDDDGMRERRI